MLTNPIVLEEGWKEEIKWIIITLGSHPCAYVGIDKNHPPIYGQNVYSTELWDNIECHGGITYFSEEFVFYNKKDRYWAGWDYGHIGDHQEIAEFYIKQGKKWTLKEIKEDIFGVVEQLIIRDELVYKINNLITVKLQGVKSVIYVKEKRFNQCKFLLLNIPIKNIKNTETLESIDQVEEYLNKNESEGINLIRFNISPEEQFQAHCSNLQAWSESNYNTRLLHRNLAFPLLKALSQAGDNFANIRLKEEIIDRYNLGTLSVKTFLRVEGYLKLLNIDENKLLK